MTTFLDDTAANVAAKDVRIQELTAMVDRQSQTIALLLAENQKLKRQLE
ncbi:MAG: hypothetical protein AAGD09_03510 [Cyanobacteria bacterium P01_F01_bin.56]